MNKLTKRKLELLDGQFKDCDKCILRNNGMVKPYWTEQSKYMIIGQSPDETEVRDNKPFSGTKGDMFWKIMAEHQLTKREFLVLYSVQCRIVNRGNKTGRPSEMHRDICRDWIKKYVKVLKPQKVLLMGNFAINSITGEWGIDDMYKKQNNLVSIADLFGHKTTIVRSCLPGALIYEKGREKDLRTSIELFKGA